MLTSKTIVLTIIGTALLSFFAVSALLATTALADWSPRGSSDDTAVDLEEAARRAGYAVRQPAVPAGYELAAIRVIEPRLGRPHRVEQVWVDSSTPGDGFVIVQDPSLSGLGGAEPTEIAGQAAYRSVEPAIMGREHELLGFFWRDDSMGFTLTGSLTETQDEAVLRSIVESMID